MKFHKLTIVPGATPVWVNVESITYVYRYNGQTRVCLVCQEVFHVLETPEDIMAGVYLQEMPT